jgi:hypothetical protein
MTIEMLQFKEPVVQDITEGDPFRWAIGAIVANFDHVVILPEGNYDLTPTSWTHNAGRHELTVFENGNALYRMIPLRQDTAVFDSARRDRGFVSGGRTQLIPEDAEVTLLASPAREGGTKVEIHNIIFYIPGPSPRKPLSRQ